LEHARQYNCTFQFASSAAHVDTAAEHGMPEGLYMFKISGNLSHQIGPLLPTAAQPPQYAQLYVIDDHNTQLAQRSHLAVASGLRRSLLEALQIMLLQHNPYARTFRSAAQLDAQRAAEGRQPMQDMHVVLRAAPHGTRADDIAAIVPGDNDIQVRRR
jgi:hypothetical protein